jgi:hypothetical protein
MGKPNAQTSGILLTIASQNIACITVPEHEDAQSQTSIWTSVFQHDLGALEPIFRLLYLADRCIELRRTALKTLSSYANTLDEYSIKTLLIATKCLNGELLSWYNTLPIKYESGGNYWILFAKNLCLCHRIFLEDTVARCCHLLRHLDTSHYDPQIIECVETASMLIDHVCANMPYDFGDNDSRMRLKNRNQKPFTTTNTEMIFHLAFRQVTL